MKNLYLFIFAGLFIFSSCNSNNEEKKANSDNKIIEIDSSTNNTKNQNTPPISNESNAEKKKSKLDKEFEKFLEKFAKASLPYSIKPETNFNNERIPLDLQTKYLLKAEGLDKKGLIQMQNYAKFYFISNPISTNKFNAIVYGRLETGSSYYLLCTYNNDGKIISFIDFAMHQVIGAGPQAGQEYTMNGSIDKNLLVTTVSDQSSTHYQIKENGKIVKK